MESKSIALCCLLLHLCLGGVCGRVVSRPANDAPALGHSRIVGGNITTQGQFPSMVALYHESLFGSTFICGGTLLNPNHVLTAAQCLDGYTASSVIAVVGDQNLYDNTGLEQSFNGEEKFLHDFSTSTGANDIGILKVSSSFTLQPGVVEVVPLPSDYQTPNFTCTAVGWGTTLINNTAMSAELRAVELPFITDDICADIYSPEPYLMDMMCAGVTGGAGVCKGDGGGPLFCDGVQMGITSRGRNCDFNPAIFTEVSHYLDWINIHAEM